MVENCQLLGAVYSHYRFNYFSDN